jgi:hypothetical protein
MQKLLVAVLVIIVLALGAYWVYSQRGPAPFVNEVDTPIAVAVVVSTTTVAEETDLFIVDVVYPHFGVAAIDTSIDAMMRSHIATIKSDAAAIDFAPTAKYELTTRFDSVYTSERVVSARLIVSHYTGGAHPNSTVVGLNFNPATGEKYTLQDALAMIDLPLPQLATQSKIQLQAETGEALQFPEGADATAENYSAFVISANKVTFYFQPYQVAAYAAGILDVSFPRK